MGAITLIVVLLVAGVAVGLIAGRWWALALAVLVPLAFVPFGDDSDGAPQWITGLFLYAPPALLGLAVGVGVRRMATSRAS